MRFATEDGNIRPPLYSVFEIVCIIKPQIPIVNTQRSVIRLNLDNN